MAYQRELDRGESIVIRKEAEISTTRSLMVKHPLGDILVTLIEKTGRRARLEIVSDTEFYMEHVGQVKPKAT